MLSYPTYSVVTPLGEFTAYSAESVTPSKREGIASLLKQAAKGNAQTLDFDISDEVHVIIGKDVLVKSVFKVY